MLSRTMIASAILAGASFASAGSAIVVNKCTYPVSLCNTPSANGGYSQIDKTLASGDSYSQDWTSLSNGNGWSIKLSPNGNFGDHILQYEYTYHNDGIIWYDLSEVNGNPWNGNWEITSSNSQCNPLQQAYRYATDDAYGMQSCFNPDETSVTVTLCSGESQDNGEAAAASSSVAAVTTTAAPSQTYVAPVSSTTEAAKPTLDSYVPQAAAPKVHHNNAASKPTTLATVASTTTAAPAGITGGALQIGANGVVVEVDTVYETTYTTQYVKRHGHGHPHARV